MKIIPLSDLRNTAAVSKMTTEHGQVFVTKQGCEHIVMLSHEMYETIIKENDDLKMYVKILQAEIEQTKNGNTSRPFGEFIEELKNV